MATTVSARLLAYFLAGLLLYQGSLHYFTFRVKVLYVRHLEARNYDPVQAAAAAVPLAIPLNHPQLRWLEDDEIRYQHANYDLLEHEIRYDTLFCLAVLDEIESDLWSGFYRRTLDRLAQDDDARPRPLLAWASLLREYLPTQRLTCPPHWLSFVSPSPAERTLPLAAGHTARLKRPPRVA